MLPKVVNYYHLDQPSATVEGRVFVGRPSSWGNPFKAGTHGTQDRSEAVRLFRAYATERLKFDPEWLSPLIRAKELVCYCAPKECHADVLVELLNENVA